MVRGGFSECGCAKVLTSPDRNARGRALAFQRLQSVELADSDLSFGRDDDPVGVDAQAHRVVAAPALVSKLATISAICAAKNGGTALPI